MRSAAAFVIAGVIAIVAAGCVLDSSDDNGAEHDDINGSDSGSGSGSDVAIVVETSPRDHGLEAMSGALGLAIVIAPIGLRRRRAKS